MKTRTYGVVFIQRWDKFGRCNSKVLETRSRGQLSNTFGWFIATQHTICPYMWIRICFHLFRDHFVYAHSQWETALQCTVFYPSWRHHKWKHFPRYWPFMRRNHRSPVDSPHKGPWRRALMCVLICALTHGLANNRGIWDFRRHCAHYDVTVMIAWAYAPNDPFLFSTEGRQSNSYSASPARAKFGGYSVYDCWWTNRYNTWPNKGWVY